MPHHAPSDPVDLVDLQFIETRHKLLEVAAFLDRMQRHGMDGDARVRALQEVLPILQEPRADRVRRILEALSDPSTELLAKAPCQGAWGAPPLTQAQPG